MLTIVVVPLFAVGEWQKIPPPFTICTRVVDDSRPFEELIVVLVKAGVPLPLMECGENVVEPAIDGDVMPLTWMAWKLEELKVGAKTLRVGVPPVGPTSDIHACPCPRRVLLTLEPRFHSYSYSRSDFSPLLPICSCTPPPQHGLWQLRRGSTGSDRLPSRWMSSCSGRRGCPNVRCGGAGGAWWCRYRLILVMGSARSCTPNR